MPNISFSPETSGASRIPLNQRGALTTELAAIYIGSSAGTLHNKRSKGLGPPFVRDGCRVIYRVKDLDEYLRKNLVGGGAR